MATVNVLVVAGGGGGGAYFAGGGGAGGIVNDTAHTITSGTAYTVTVGAGGSGSSSGAGSKGSDSVFHTITANGGGFGQQQCLQTPRRFCGRPRLRGRAW